MSNHLPFTVNGHGVADVLLSLRMADDNTPPPVSSLVTGLQRDVLAWSQATFPHETVNSKYEHLKREVKELKDALDGGVGEEIEGEIADCFILLAGIAQMQDVDLFTAAVKKLSINKSRQWGKPDKDGVSSHIESATA